MKKILLSTMGLFVGNAYCMDVRPYIEGRIITLNQLKAEYEESILSEKFKDIKPGIGLEFGTKISQFRFGLEGYYNGDMEDELADVIPVEGKTRGVFLNAYYDIPTSNKISPYIGGGIGYSWLEGSIDMSQYGFGTASVKDNDMSWNVGFGVTYNGSDNVGITLGYRYESLGRIEKDGAKIDFTNNKLSLGIRYTF